MFTPELPEATALLASLLSQMTRFSCLGCPTQAIAIRQQLALLQTYPNSQMPPLLKAVARRLEGEWSELHFAIADDPVTETQGAAGARPALH